MNANEDDNEPAKLTCEDAERLVGIAADIFYSGKAYDDFDMHAYYPRSARIEWTQLTTVFGSPPGLNEAIEYEQARFVDSFIRAQDAYLDAVNAAREVFQENTFREAVRLTEPNG